MASRIGSALLLAGVLIIISVSTGPTPACCPAPPANIPVVNADQTVIILWDAASKTQHFIRKASFNTEADDFGFIVPSPTVPELEESGEEAFPHLQKLTEPSVITIPRPSAGIGCGAHMSSEPGLAAGGVDRPWVKVLEVKEVAGYKATVLETESSSALVGWLNENGFAFSPEVAAWAKPYIEGGWKFTALKMSKKNGSAEKAVAAGSLRISFKTERPLFPYREPDPEVFAKALSSKQRLLRIYFIAEARYRGDVTKETPWTGKVAWSGKLNVQTRQKLLEELKLPSTTGPANWWLTEFEDLWPYKSAPADVYFSRDSNQRNVRRDPILQYASADWPSDASVYAIAGAVLLPPVVRRLRRRKPELRL